MPALHVAMALLLCAAFLAACSEPEEAPPVIPPCAPIEGAPNDPCAVGNHQYDTLRFHADAVWEANAGNVRSHLDGDYPVRVAHIVIRATTLPGTIRCTHGLYRYLPGESGGEWREGTSFRCFIDVRVNEYLVGTGPATLTVQYLAPPRHLLGAKDVQQLTTDIQRAMTEGGTVGELRLPSGGIEGREWVMFLKPPYDVGFEVWRRGESWDVQQMADGSIVAIHPGFGLTRVNWMIILDRPSFREAQEPKPLNELVREVKAAHMERSREYRGRIGADKDSPKLVQDARDLRDHFMAIGAYDHPAGPPLQPPPVRSPR